MWSFFARLASPKKLFFFSNRAMAWLIILFLLAFTYGIIGGLLLAPADYLQGDGFRIMYVHVPCAFLSIFIYAAMAIAAVSSLIWKLKVAPLVIKHSAPIGASFTLLALLTGSLWGKPMWGTWWMWDARLTSELILLFLYIGIILFQSALRQKQFNERIVAILVLVGFIDIPIIHYSVYWWNTLHQGSTLKLFSPSTIESSMLYPLLAMILAFLVYYILILLLKIRFDLVAIQHNDHWLKKQ
ncbi:MAG: heme ABC transporter permease [Gammaproteobacteria bacterium RIFCSPHIGHO2_12_FULL_37_14]|nr:MAG: heme ABC transporter permease [Gammaproteobacteria bacterium RIFCSPHIGHO2_12_FULL_37_14]